MDQLPEIQSTTIVSSDSNTSWRSVSRTSQSTLPKLPMPRNIKVKVSPNIIDDAKLADGMDLSTGDILFPTIPLESLKKKKSTLLMVGRNSNINIRRLDSQLFTQQNYVVSELHSDLRTPDDGDSIEITSVEDGATNENLVVDQVIKETGIKRFRTIARMIKNNLSLARHLNRIIAGMYDKSIAFTVRDKSGEDPAQILSFNLNSFKVATQTHGGLTLIARKILLLPPEHRTEDDVDILKEVIERLKCFAAYSQSVKHELARFIHLDYFEDGRKIIQQGYEGLSFYFIVHGVVTITRTELDIRTGRMKSQVIGELQEGESFGELALLHNIEREASYFCKGNCEFLRIDKEDFNGVLRSSCEYEYQRRYSALKQIPALCDVDNTTLMYLSNHSNLIQVAANKVIVGDTTESSDNVHFILKGEVKVIRRIVTWRESLPYGGYRLVLKSSEMFDPRSSKSLITFFKYYEENRLFTLFNLKRGNFFNVGENLTNTYFISMNKVEIIQVPRILFTRFGLASKLETLKLDLDAALPSDRTTFELYIANKKWKKFKRSMTMKIVKKRDYKNTATLSDVPLTIRMKKC